MELVKARAVDFHAQLRKQLDFLTTSCSVYDAGNKDEGVRIATSLRILFHQTRNSTSLLTHLHAQNIRLLSTCGRPRPGVGFWAGITNMQFMPPLLIAEFIPKLDTAETKQYISFGSWWEDQTIYVTRQQGRVVKLTRRKIILAAANTDGGAHVDGVLDPQYEHVLDGAGWSMIWSPDDGSTPTEVKFKHAHLSALRQMAHEVLSSPDLVRLGNGSMPAQKTE